MARRRWPRRVRCPYQPSGRGYAVPLLATWLGNKMASDALSAFEQAGGRRLIFIGEPKGGMTGDDAPRLGPEMSLAAPSGWGAARLVTCGKSVVSTWGEHHPEDQGVVAIHRVRHVGDHDHLVVGSDEALVNHLDEVARSRL